MPVLIAVSSIFQNNRDTLPRTYSQAIYSSDAVPVILTPSTSLSDALLISDKCDSLLLSGGGDIYKPDSQFIFNADKERDEWETLLILAFTARKKRILGICRGIQVIAGFYKGGLIEDINTFICHKSEQDVYHSVNVVENTLLSSLINEGNHTVNSAHHQAPLYVPDSLTVNAYSPDNIIEGIEGDNLLAVQWHPERMSGYSALFEWLSLKK